MEDLNFRTLWGDAYLNYLGMVDELASERMERLKTAQKLFHDLLREWADDEETRGLIQESLAEIEAALAE